MVEQEKPSKESRLNGLKEAHDAIKEVVSVLEEFPRFKEKLAESGRRFSARYGSLTNSDFQEQEDMSEKHVGLMARFQEALIAGREKLEPVRDDFDSSLPDSPNALGRATAAGYHSLGLKHAELAMEELAANSGMGVTEALEVEPFYLVGSSEDEVYPHSRNAVLQWMSSQRSHLTALAQLRSDLGAEYRVTVESLSQDVPKPSCWDDMKKADQAILNALSPEVVKGWKDVARETDYGHDYVRERGSALVRWGFVVDRGGKKVLSEEGLSIRSPD